MFARRIWGLVAAVAVISLLPMSLHAQGSDASGSTPKNTAKAKAPTDFTGQWISVVSEDWRYRMILPKKGDFGGVPVSSAGRKMANSWDPSKDEAAGEQCRSYGAAGVMRIPGRIRISWADAETLKIETEAGTQTRLFYFKDPKTSGGDWQGRSQATWETRNTRAGTGGPNFGGGGGEIVNRTIALSGGLDVVTTNLKPGYLRKNGVPYSDKTVLTEYYDRTEEPNGDSWLVVQTIVDDPVYLDEQFITSSHFKKQNDQSGWNPTPCSSR